MTHRCDGTPAPSRSGRVRLLANFIGRLTTAEFTPIAVTPVSAARRPRSPPTRKRPAAIESHSPELFGESGEATERLVERRGRRLGDRAVDRSVDGCQFLQRLGARLRDHGI